MRRVLILLYGIVAYLAFVAVMLYAIAFLGNMFVPRTIDSPAVIPLGHALLVNMGLIVLFGLQHSGMARAGFKQAMHKIAPAETERSSYVLVSSAALGLLMLCWQPIGGVVWQLADPVVVGAIRATYIGGWVLMTWSSCMICHFELFGLRQAWFAFRGQAYEACEFKTPAAYRIIRHPIYASWLIVLWAAPVMTITHLVLAIGLTLYTLVGIALEERDLRRQHPDYAQYSRKVPALIPSLRRHLRTRGRTIIDS